MAPSLRSRAGFRACVSRFCGWLSGPGRGHRDAAQHPHVVPAESRSCQGPATPLQVELLTRVKPTRSEELTQDREETCEVSHAPTNSPPCSDVEPTICRVSTEERDDTAEEDWCPPESLPSPGPGQAAECIASAIPPPLPRSTWWEDADPLTLKGLQEATTITRLLSATLVSSNAAEAPWENPAAGAALYAQMGLRDTSKSYVAFWVHMGKVSMCALGEVLSAEHFKRCFVGNCLKERLKLILRPVKVKLPFPAKSPKNAEYMGNYFGPQGASLTQLSASSEAGVDNGGAVACLRVDLYSKSMVRMALQRVGFRVGNVVELVVVDWSGLAVPIAIRLSMTDEILNWLA